MDDKLKLMKQQIDKSKTDLAVVESQIQDIQIEMKKKYNISELEEGKIELNKKKKIIDKLEIEYDNDLNDLNERFPWE